MNVKTKIENALEAMQRFITTLNDENAYLGEPQKVNNKAHKELIERKKADCSFYEHCIQSLAVNKTELSALPQEIKQAILDMQQAVSDAVRENALQIKTQLHVTEQITTIFKQAILDESKKHQTYAPQETNGKSPLQDALTYSAKH